MKNPALDTCGFAPRGIYAAMLPYTDTFLFDVKHCSGEGYLHCTGRLLSEIRTTRVRLLPYHSYARSKYAALDLHDTLPCADSPDKTKLESAAALLRAYKPNIITN